MVQEARILRLLWPAKVTPNGVTLAGQSKHVRQSNPFWGYFGRPRRDQPKLTKLAIQKLFLRFLIAHAGIITSCTTTIHVFIISRIVKWNSKMFLKMRFYRWKPDARRYGSVTQLKFDKAMSQLKSGRSQRYV